MENPVEVCRQCRCREYGIVPAVRRINFPTANPLRTCSASGAARLHHALPCSTRLFTFHWAGGSPAAGYFPCAAKESNQRKAAPGVVPTVQRVALCCLTRLGGCGTRPGRAHRTCPATGLEQSSPTTPSRVELLGAPQGEATARARATARATARAELFDYDI